MTFLYTIQFVNLISIRCNGTSCRIVHRYIRSLHEDLLFSSIQPQKIVINLWCSSNLFDDIVDITSKESLPDVQPNSILISDRTTFFFQKIIWPIWSAFNVHPYFCLVIRGLSYPLGLLGRRCHGVSIHEINRSDAVTDSSKKFHTMILKLFPYFIDRQYIIHALHQNLLTITDTARLTNKQPDPFHHKRRMANCYCPACLYTPIEKHEVWLKISFQIYFDVIIPNWWYWRLRHASPKIVCPENNLLQLDNSSIPNIKPAISSGSVSVLTVLPFLMFDVLLNISFLVSHIQH